MIRLGVGFLLGAIVVLVWCKWSAINGAIENRNRIGGAVKIYEGAQDAFGGLL